MLDLGVVRPHPKAEALKWRILKKKYKKSRLFDVHELLEKFIDIFINLLLLLGEGNTCKYTEN